MADSEILVLCQDMTISREDFLRCLSGAVNHVAFTVDPASGIRSLDPAQRWRITLTPLPDLGLGPVRLPRQRVAIYLDRYDAAETTRFLDRFERYYRRGGG